MTYLITFSSHFDAILAKRTLQSAGIAVELMPVPRTVSASCGTCIVFDAAGEELPLRETTPPVKLEHIYQKGPSGWERMEPGPLD